MKQENPKFIDVFAGCGGLSLGLIAAGFDLSFAIEKSSMAAETFFHNLIDPIDSSLQWESHLRKSKGNLLEIAAQVGRGLFVGETMELIEALASDDEFAAELSRIAGPIDLVAGGPPCQGFSTAGLRNHADLRNQLPLQFIKIVEFFNPKAVLMENVVGMRQRFSSMSDSDEIAFHGIHRLLQSIGSGYEVQELCLNAHHYGVPQTRPRVMLLGIRKDIIGADRIRATSGVWNSRQFFSSDVGNGMCPMPLSGKARTVLDAISDLYGAKGQNRDYLEELNGPGGLGTFLTKKNRSSQEISNHTKRNHSQRVITRFRLYQYLDTAGISRSILNIAARYRKTEQSDLKAKIKRMLRSGPIPAICPNGVVLANSSAQLFRIVVEHGTSKHSQRLLKPNLPAPTVLSIPDDVVHPIEARTMTVREQARFQSFPDSFEFRGKETTGGQARKTEVPQYTQVGNAVPPLVAREVGKLIKQLVLEFVQDSNTTILGSSEAGSEYHQARC